MVTKIQGQVYAHSIKTERASEITMTPALYCHAIWMEITFYSYSYLVHMHSMHQVCVVIKEIIMGL